MHMVQQLAQLSVNYNQILTRQVKRQLLPSHSPLLESSNVLTRKGEVFQYVAATAYAFARFSIRQCLGLELDAYLYHISTSVHLFSFVYILYM